MSDKGVITVGLVVFVGLVTLPFWYVGIAGSSADRNRPELELPADATQCVEDTSFMTGNHMELLDQWREAVVREGQTEYTSQAFGTHYEMSLTKTCLRCHSDREKFCDRCHNYADVHPPCWDCHLDREGN